jgi:hypothetical protein
MAEPAHDFFEDLEARMLNTGADGEKISSILSDLRRDWRGAQIYVSAYTDHSQFVHRVRSAWQRHKLEFCRQYGITPSTLDKINAGRPPTQHTQDQII